jgi:hypothetical protein
VEQSFQLGGEEALGDVGDELGEEAVEGDEEQEGVADAVLEGLGGPAEVEGEVSGRFQDLGGEALEVGWGEGMAMAAVFEGVEVARGRTRATGAELGIAVGAAAGMAAHGPVAAAGNLTGGLVGVSGHGG